MADRNMTKTALAQGKFSRSYDRPQLEARPRASLGVIERFQER